MENLAFSNYTRNVQSKFQHNGMALASWGSLLAFALAMLYARSIMVELRIPKLPIAMKDEIPSARKRKGLYVNDTRKLLAHGYEKARHSIFGRFRRQNRVLTSLL